MNLPMTGLIIYWWNPLLIKEIYNSGHMEVMLFPFVLGAIFLALDQKYLWASLAVGLAFGVKFWPALLWPVLLRPVLGDPRRIIAPGLCLVALAAATFYPFYLTGLGEDSGLTNYGRGWEMNDTLFMIVLWMVQFFKGFLNMDRIFPQTITRIIVASLVLILTFWIIRPREDSPLKLNDRVLFVIAALFLLSPTQFPWYYLWLLPLLAIRPRAELLFLSVTLPLYYLRFYLDVRGMAHVHDTGVVWLEFLPVWLLFVRVCMGFVKKKVFARKFFRHH
jgi:hypothetical protein